MIDQKTADDYRVIAAIMTLWILFLILFALAMLSLMVG